MPDFFPDWALTYAGRAGQVDAMSAKKEFATWLNEDVAKQQAGGQIEHVPRLGPEGEPVVDEYDMPIQDMVGKFRVQIPLQGPGLGVDWHGSANILINQGGKPVIADFKLPMTWTGAHNPDKYAPKLTVNQATYLQKFGVKPDVSIIYVGPGTRVFLDSALKNSESGVRPEDILEEITNPSSSSEFTNKAIQAYHTATQSNQKREVQYAPVTALPQEQMDPLINVHKRYDEAIEAATGMTRSQLRNTLASEPREGDHARLYAFMDEVHFRAHMYAIGAYENTEVVKSFISNVAPILPGHDHGGTISQTIKNYGKAPVAPQEQRGVAPFEPLRNADEWEQLDERLGDSVLIRKGTGEVAITHQREGEFGRDVYWRGAIENLGNKATADGKTIPQYAINGRLIVPQQLKRYDVQEGQQVPGTQWQEEQTVLPAIFTEAVRMVKGFGGGVNAAKAINSYMSNVLQPMPSVRSDVFATSAARMGYAHNLLGLEEGFSVRQQYKAMRNIDQYRAMRAGTRQSFDLRDLAQAAGFAFDPEKDKFYGGEAKPGAVYKRTRAGMRVGELVMPTKVEGGTRVWDADRMMISPLVQRDPTGKTRASRYGPEIGVVAKAATFAHGGLMSEGMAYGTRAFLGMDDEGMMSQQVKDTITIEGDVGFTGLDQAVYDEQSGGFVIGYIGGDPENKVVWSKQKWDRFDLGSTPTFRTEGGKTMIDLEGKVSTRGGSGELKAWMGNKAMLAAVNNLDDLFGNSAVKGLDVVLPKAKNVRQFAYGLISAKYRDDPTALAKAIYGEDRYKQHMVYEDMQEGAGGIALGEQAVGRLQEIRGRMGKESGYQGVLMPLEEEDQERMYGLANDIAKERMQENVQYRMHVTDMEYETLKKAGIVMKNLGTRQGTGGDSVRFIEAQVPAIFSDLMLQIGREFPGEAQVSTEELLGLASDPGSVGGAWQKAVMGKILPGILESSGHYRKMYSDILTARMHTRGEAGVEVDESRIINLQDLRMHVGDPGRNTAEFLAKLGDVEEAKGKFIRVGEMLIPPVETLSALQVPDDPAKTMPWLNEEERRKLTIETKDVSAITNAFKRLVEKGLEADTVVKLEQSLYGTGDFGDATGLAMQPAVAKGAMVARMTKGAVEGAAVSFSGVDDNVIVMGKDKLMKMFGTSDYGVVNQALGQGAYAALQRRPNVFPELSSMIGVRIESADSDYAKLREIPPDFAGVAFGRMIAGMMFGDYDGDRIMALLTSTIAQSADGEVHDKTDSVVKYAASQRGMYERWGMGMAHIMGHENARTVLGKAEGEDYNAEDMLRLNIMLGKEYSEVYKMLGDLTEGQKQFIGAMGVSQENRGQALADMFLNKTAYLAGVSSQELRGALEGEAVSKEETARAYNRLLREMHGYIAQTGEGDVGVASTFGFRAYQKTLDLSGFSEGLRGYLNLWEGFNAYGKGKSLQERLGPVGSEGQIPSRDVPLYALRDDFTTQLMQNMLNTEELWGAPKSAVERAGEGPTGYKFVDDEKARWNAQAAGISSDEDTQKAIYEVLSTGGNAQQIMEKVFGAGVTEDDPTKLARARFVNAWKNPGYLMGAPGAAAFSRQEWSMRKGDFSQTVTRTAEWDRLNRMTGGQMEKLAATGRGMSAQTALLSGRGGKDLPRDIEQFPGIPGSEVMDKMLGFIGENQPTRLLNPRSPEADTELTLLQKSEVNLLEKIRDQGISPEEALDAVSIDEDAHLLRARQEIIGQYKTEPERRLASQVLDRVPHTAKQLRTLSDKLFEHRLDVEWEELEAKPAGPAFNPKQSRSGPIHQEAIDQWDNPKKGQLYRDIPKGYILVRRALEAPLEIADRSSGKEQMISVSLIPEGDYEASISKNRPLWNIKLKDDSPLSNMYIQDAWVSTVQPGQDPSERSLSETDTPVFPGSLKAFANIWEGRRTALGDKSVHNEIVVRRSDIVDIDLLQGTYKGKDPSGWRSATKQIEAAPYLKEYTPETWSSKWLASKVAGLIPSRQPPGEVADLLRLISGGEDDLLVALEKMGVDPSKLTDVMPALQQTIKEMEQPELGFKEGKWEAGGLAPRIIGKWGQMAKEEGGIGAVLQQLGQRREAGVVPAKIFGYQAKEGYSHSDPAMGVAHAMGMTTVDPSAFRQESLPQGYPGEQQTAGGQQQAGGGGVAGAMQTMMAQAASTNDPQMFQGLRMMLNRLQYGDQPRVPMAKQMEALKPSETFQETYGHAYEITKQRESAFALAQKKHEIEGAGSIQGAMSILEKTGDVGAAAQILPKLTEEHVATLQGLDTALAEWTKTIEPAVQSGAALTAEQEKFTSVLSKGLEEVPGLRMIAESAPESKFGAEALTLSKRLAGAGSTLAPAMSGMQARALQTSQQQATQLSSADLAWLNQAGPGGLQGITGVGPVLGQRMAGRAASLGALSNVPGFTSLGQLTGVRGIGDTTAARMAPSIRAESQMWQAGGRPAIQALSGALQQTSMADPNAAPRQRQAATNMLSSISRGLGGSASPVMQQQLAGLQQRQQADAVNALAKDLPAAVRLSSEELVRHRETLKSVQGPLSKMGTGLDQLTKQAAAGRQMNAQQQGMLGMYQAQLRMGSQAAQALPVGETENERRMIAQREMQFQQLGITQRQAQAEPSTGTRAGNFFQSVTGGFALMRLRRLWSMTGGMAMGAMQPAAQDQMMAMQAAGMGMPAEQFEMGGLAKGILGTKARQQQFQLQMGGAAGRAYGPLIQTPQAGTAAGIALPAVGVGLLASQFAGMAGLGAAGPIGAIAAGTVGLIGATNTIRSDPGDEAGNALRSYQTSQQRGFSPTQTFRSGTSAQLQADIVQDWIGRKTSFITGYEGKSQEDIIEAMSPDARQQIETGEQISRGELSGLNIGERTQAVQEAYKFAPQWMEPTAAKELATQWMRYTPDATNMEDIYGSKQFEQMATRGESVEQFVKTAGQWGSGPEDWQQYQQFYAGVAPSRVPGMEYTASKWASARTGMGMEGLDILGAAASPFETAGQRGTGADIMDKFSERLSNATGGLLDFGNALEGAVEVTPLQAERLTTLQTTQFEQAMGASERARMMGLQGVQAPEQLTAAFAEQAFQEQMPLLQGKMGVQSQLMGMGASMAGGAAAAETFETTGQMQMFQRLLGGDKRAMSVLAQGSVQGPFNPMVDVGGGMQVNAGAIREQAYLAPIKAGLAGEGYDQSQIAQMMAPVVQTLDNLKPVIETATGLQMGTTGMWQGWSEDITGGADIKGGATRQEKRADFLQGQGMRLPEIGGYGGVDEHLFQRFADILQDEGTRGVQAEQQTLANQYQEFQMGQRRRGLEWSSVSQLGGTFSEPGLGEISTRGTLEITKELRSMNRLWEDFTSTYNERSREVAASQFMENWQVQAERMPVQFGWQREDLAAQGAQTSMQFGWQMEDLQESERFATGRDRRKIQRQQERAAISYSMQMGRLDTQGERVDVREQWGQEDLERQRRQFMERNALQDDYQAHYRANMEQRRQLEDEMYAVQEYGARFQIQQAEEALAQQEIYQERQKAINEVMMAYQQSLENANAQMGQVVQMVQFLWSNFAVGGGGEYSLPNAAAGFFASVQAGFAAAAQSIQLPYSGRPGAYR